MRGAWPAIRNVLKAWALLVGLCAAFGALGWWLGGCASRSVFGFCGLLVGVGVYWYADRVAIGMVGARELPAGRGAGAALDWSSGSR